MSVSGAVDTKAAETKTAEIALTVNGSERHLDPDPRTSLLDALREHLHLTGTKKGCDHGQWGACTVLINGRRINSCLTLAVMHEGDEIHHRRTGLARRPSPHASRLCRVRRLPMRLLHPRSDLFGRRHAGRSE